MVPSESAGENWEHCAGWIAISRAYLQRSAFVLLAPRRQPEEHKNRSIGQAITDARKSERRLAGMEIPEPLQPSGGFCLPLGEAQRQETARSRFSVKEENPRGD